MEKKLPSCGAFIKYVSKINNKDVAEFTFKTENVEPYLLLKGEDGFTHGYDQPGSLYYWVSRRKKGLDGVTDIPVEIEYLDDFMGDMIREVPVIVRCLKCDKQLSSDELQYQSDSRKSGWLHDKLLCPNGHELLSVPVMHIRLSR